MDVASAYEKSELILLETSFVTPAVPTEKGRHLFLSSLDLYWREFLYNRRLLFYKVSLDEQPLMIDALKSSLSKVLVHFYPAAGRLAVGEDGRTGIDCSDQGVEFVDAAVDASLHGLENANFEPNPFFNKLARWSEHDLTKVNDIPLLSIQVTRFACGGIAVGYAHSHVLADGHSMWHFMKSWAECARNEAVSLIPVHTRIALKVDNPSEELAAQMNLPAAVETGIGEVGPLKPKEPLVERLFHFTTEMINKLKKIAAEEGAGLSFTSFEVLCAHWWRGVIRARNLEDEAIVRFPVLADMRSKITPPLSPAFFGNAIIFAFNSTTAGELSKESLAATAARVRQASSACTPTAMWAKIHWLELHGTAFGSRLQWGGSCMTVASSPKFPVYSVDFGWGKPAAVRTVRVNGDGEMVLFAGREGGVDICMPLTKEAMERLKKDPHFLNF